MFNKFAMFTRPLTSKKTKSNAIPIVQQVSGCVKVGTIFAASCVALPAALENIQPNQTGNYRPMK